MMMIDMDVHMVVCIVCDCAPLSSLRSRLCDPPGKHAFVFDAFHHIHFVHASWPAF